MMVYIRSGDVIRTVIVFFFSLLLYFGFFVYVCVYILYTVVVTWLMFASFFGVCFIFGS